MFIWGLHVYAWERSVLWERRSLAMKMAFPMEVSNVSYNSSCNKDEVWLRLENVYTWGMGGCGDWWRTLVVLHSTALACPQGGLHSTCVVWDVCLWYHLFKDERWDDFPVFIKLHHGMFLPQDKQRAFRQVNLRKNSGFCGNEQQYKLSVRVVSKTGNKGEEHCGDQD